MHSYAGYMHLIITISQNAKVSTPDVYFSFFFTVWRWALVYTLQRLIFNKIKHPTHSEIERWYGSLNNKKGWKSKIIKQCNVNTVPPLWDNSTFGGNNSSFQRWGRSMDLGKWKFVFNSWSRSDNCKEFEK